MNTTAENLDAPLGSDTERSAPFWRVWRILLPAMLWLSLLGDVMWRAYPDYLYLVVSWTVLTAAMLWWSNRMMLRQLGLPAREVPYFYDETTSRRRPYDPVRSVLSGSLLYFLLGTFTLLFEAFISPPGTLTQVSPLYIFTVATVITLFSSFWPSRTYIIRRLFARPRAQIFLILPSSLAFIVALFVIPRLLAGSPAPLPTMLAFAQHEADKIDRETYLDNLSATRNYYFEVPSEAKYPFDVTYHFVGRTHIITIDVLDTDPPRLIKVQSTSTNGPAHDLFGQGRSDAEVQKTKDTTAKITVGPRNVYLMTENEGRAFAIKNKSVPSDLIVNVGLSFDPHPYGSQGVNVFWAINYLARSPDGLKALDIRVDAVTDKILDRGEH